MPSRKEHLVKIEKYLDKIKAINEGELGDEFQDRIETARNVLRNRFKTIGYNRQKEVKVSRNEKNENRTKGKRKNLAKKPNISTGKNNFKPNCTLSFNKNQKNQAQKKKNMKK